MITTYICGGLGNQLFQIFTTIAYALRNNKNFWFLYSEKYKNPSIERNSYWNTFFSSSQFNQYIYKLPPNGCTKTPFKYIESGFQYQMIPGINHDNICLQGYFQSYKYFLDEFDSISEILEIEKKKNVVREKCEIFFEDFVGFDFSTTASIHFRLGDYKKYPMVHPITPEIYYIESIRYLIEATKNKNNSIQTVLYFHENNILEKEDLQTVVGIITHLRKEFTYINFIDVSDNSNNEFQDWEQMLLMSCCHYNIIANSTFSWWGGFLNSFVDKIVIYPEKWFGESSKNNVCDLFPDDWIKI